MIGLKILGLDFRNLCASHTAEQLAGYGLPTLVIRSTAKYEERAQIVLNLFSTKFNFLCLWPVELSEVSNVAPG